MTPAASHTRLILAAESLARDTFDSVTLTSGSCERTITLQKEFVTFSLLARQKFNSLKTDLATWQELVQRGDLEFTSEQEDNFKASLHASVGFLSYLIEKFDDHVNGFFLGHPKFVRLMKSDKQEAEKILHSWLSPEWRTVNERIVKWDKDQSQYLREKLGCN